VYTLQVDITLTLPKGTPRAPYFFMGHAVLTFDVQNEINNNNDNNTLLRIDFADAVPDNIVQVRDPPIIYTVSTGMIIAVSVAIAICGGIALMLFSYVTYYRHHAVMKLSQAPFLMAFTFFNLLSIVFSFTNLPVSDTFCQIHDPIIFIALTAIGAIMVARTWRIYTTLAVALAFGRSAGRTATSDSRNRSSNNSSDDSPQGGEGRLVGNVSNGVIQVLDVLAKVPLCSIVHTTGGDSSVRLKSNRHQSLRSMVPEREAINLAFMLTLPQIVLQVICLVQDAHHLFIELTPDGTIGREMCEMNKMSIDLAAVGIAALPCIIALYLVWIAKDLPSFLNEKDQVFHASGTCMVVAIVAFTLMLVLNEPTTSVDLVVFLKCLMSIGIPVIMLFYVTWPKVARVLSGEKVIVSSLFSTRIQPSTATSDHTDSSANHHANNGDVTQVHGNTEVASPRSFLTTVKLKKDDPLPLSLEKCSVEVYQRLGQLSQRCGEGRALNAEEWKSLKVEIARLKMEVDKIEITWDDDDDDYDEDVM
jgi:hypothetical protein